MATKMFTKDEIKAFTLAEAERHAVGLDWSRYPASQYRDRGCPATFGSSGGWSNKGTRVADRHQYLIKRLLASKQERWNTEAAAELAVAREAELAERAAQDKVEQEKWKTTDKVKVKPSVRIELHDVRKDGHTFIIVRENGSINAYQKKNTGAKKGQTNCGAAENFSAQAFQDTIELICELELPTIPEKLQKGSAKVNIHASISLQGNNGNEVGFFRKGNIVGVSQQDRYKQRTLTELRDGDWQFTVEDLKKVIELMNAKYTIELA